jgi:hypothetical protein
MRMNVPVCSNCPRYSLNALTTRMLWHVWRVTLQKTESYLNHIGSIYFMNQNWKKKSPNNDVYFHLGCNVRPHINRRYAEIQRKISSKSWGLVMEMRFSDEQTDSQNTCFVFPQNTPENVIAYYHSTFNYNISFWNRIELITVPTYFGG